MQMQSPLQAAKPSIHIYTVDGASTVLLKCLQNGIEEEGIPTDIKILDLGDTIQTAYEAANNSQLEVGIAIDNGFAVLHYRKLPLDEPLFKIRVNDPDKVRSLGANAGRLVKKLPLKPLQNG